MWDVSRCPAALRQRLWANLKLAVLAGLCGQPAPEIYPFYPSVWSFRPVQLFTWVMDLNSGPHACEQAP